MVLLARSAKGGHELSKLVDDLAVGDCCYPHKTDKANQDENDQT